jgi:hypothetical protein
VTNDRLCVVLDCSEVAFWGPETRMDLPLNALLDDDGMIESSIGKMVRSVFGIFCTLVIE